MPVVITRYVNPASTPGGDGTTNGVIGPNRAFASWSEWQSNQARDLVSLDEIAECIMESGVDSTGTVNIAGWVTDNDHFIDIKASQTAETNGLSRDQTGSGYQLSGSGNNLVRINADFVRITGIEIKSTSTSILTANLAPGVSSDVRIDKCLIIYTGALSGNYAVIPLATYDWTITNTTFVGACRGADLRPLNSVTIDHCGFYGTGTLGLLVDPGDVVTNTWCFGYTSQCFWTGGASPTGSNNASSDATATIDYPSSLINRVDTVEFNAPSLISSVFNFSLKVGNTLGGQGQGGSDIGPIFSQFIVLTGPDDIIEGIAQQATGSLLDTVTTFELQTNDSSYSLLQTINGQTPSTLDYIAASGASIATLVSPSFGVPLEPTILASGTSGYQLQQKAGDGINPPTVRNVILNGLASHEVIQTMENEANTIVGQSIFGTNIISVEDNMQAYVPKMVGSLNITWFSDGTFTTDADQTEVISVVYFSPQTSQWSKIGLTIRESSVIPPVIKEREGFSSKIYSILHKKLSKDV